MPIVRFVKGAGLRRDLDMDDDVVDGVGGKH